MIVPGGGYHVLGDGVLPWAVALRHLQDSARHTVAKTDLAAVVVYGEVGVNHADRVLAFGNGIVVVEHILVRPVTLVVGDLELIRRHENDELECSFIRVHVAIGRRLIRVEGEVELGSAVRRILEKILQRYGEEERVFGRLAAEGAHTVILPAGLTTTKVRVGDLHSVHVGAMTVETVARLAVPGIVLLVLPLLFRATVELLSVEIERVEDLEQDKARE